jgi:hypothetical protein
VHFVHGGYVCPEHSGRFTWCVWVCACGWCMHFQRALGSALQQPWLCCLHTITLLATIGLALVLLSVSATPIPDQVVLRLNTIRLATAGNTTCGTLLPLVRFFAPIGIPPHYHGGYQQPWPRPCRHGACFGTHTPWLLGPATSSRAGCRSHSCCPLPDYGTGPRHTATPSSQGQAPAANRGAPCATKR